jgi:hypothetical protein
MQLLRVVMNPVPGNPLDIGARLSVTVAQLRGPSKRRNGILRHAFREQYACLVAVRGREVGVERDRPIVRRDGFVQRAGIVQRHAEAVVRVRVARVDSDRLSLALDCLIESSELVQTIAEIVVCVRGVRAEPEGLSIRRGRIVEPALPLQRDAEVVVRVGEAGIDDECAPDEVFGNVVLSHVLGQDATQIQCIGIARIGVDDLAV